jgi:hypothetical protein
MIECDVEGLGDHESSLNRTLFVQLLLVLFTVPLNTGDNFKFTSVITFIHRPYVKQLGKVCQSITVAGSYYT